MNARAGRDVADLSPGTVLIAGSTGWRYRVQAADQEADRVVLRGPRGRSRSAIVSFNAASQTDGSECSGRYRRSRLRMERLAGAERREVVDPRFQIVDLRA
jgi:hypothetical protein